MNGCPVCNTLFDFPISESEEIWCDCSHCGSSLLIKEGQCEVLSRENPPPLNESASSPDSSSLQENKSNSSLTKEGANASLQVKERGVENPNHLKTTQQQLSQIEHKGTSSKEALTESQGSEKKEGVIDSTIDSTKEEQEEPSAGVLENPAESATDSVVFSPADSFESTKRKEETSAESFPENPPQPSAHTSSTGIESGSSSSTESNKDSHLSDSSGDHVPEKEEQKAGENVSDLSSGQDSPSLENFIENDLEESDSSSEEEDFFPDENTQVPELNDEKDSSLESEGEEVFEKPSELSSDPESSEGRSNDKTSEEVSDFPFEENAGVSEEESEEGQESPLQKDEKKETLSDVAEFAKNPNPHQGPFLYDLSLKEIHSKSLTDTVLSVIEDEALKIIDEKESLSFKEKIINTGHIVLQNLSPVQAYVIVTRLMGQGLDISWTQSHIADEKSSQMIKNPTDEAEKTS